MNLRIALTGLAIVLFSSTAVAKGVPINPGQWEMTTTMEMTMLPQPQVRSSTKCVIETELSPEDLNMTQDSPCDIADVVIDGNKARWSISCPLEGGFMMEGKWEFTSGGDSISGSGSMTGEIGGNQIEFKMAWDGERVGDCP